MVPSPDLGADQDPERHDGFEPPSPFDSAAVPWTARSKTSPSFAASAKVPVDALLPAFCRHATSSALFGLREPIFTSWPRPANPVPNARPTSPLPRIPIFMGRVTHLLVYAALGNAEVDTFLSRRRGKSVRWSPCCRSPSITCT